MVYFLLINLQTLSRAKVFSDIFAISLVDWDVPKLLSLYYELLGELSGHRTLVTS